jgi:hypothetical protein
MDVFGIFIAVSFISLIVTLVVMNIIKRIKKAQEYKPYSEYYVAEKSKDLGLAAKVLSNKPKTKVLTREYDVPNKQDSQELFGTGEVSPIVGLKFNTSPNKSATCASNETPPNHKTRIALRKKRKSKQGK